MGPTSLRICRIRGPLTAESEQCGKRCNANLDVCNLAPNLAHYQVYSSSGDRSHSQPARSVLALEGGRVERGFVHAKAEYSLLSPPQDLDILVTAAHLVLPLAKGVVKGGSELIKVDLERRVKVSRHDSVEVPCSHLVQPRPHRAWISCENDLDDGKDVRLALLAEGLEIL